MRLAVACCALALVVAGSTAAGPTRREERPATLVRLVRGHAESALLRRAGAKLISARLGIWRIHAPAARELVPLLERRGALAVAEPDRPSRQLTHLTIGDPLLAGEWWLSRIGADALEPPEAGVPITVIDTGIDLTHPEFAQRPNTVTLNAQTLAGSRAFHGTAVASLAAAPANGVGVIGVYPAASLRVWDASPGPTLLSSEVIAGIGAAAAAGPSVINLSLGGPQSRLEADAVADAFARGSLIVAAAGNARTRGSPPSFPANLPHVLTVGSVDQGDRVSYFSSSTPGMDLAAPGEQIPTALPRSFDDSGFTVSEGTSLASPLVAGAAAWVWTLRPGLDVTQLFEVMRRSARDIAPPGRDPDTGFGVLHVPSALAQPAPAPDLLEPNESVEQILEKGLFPTQSRAVTTPERARATVRARLDATDDPRDIYRVWIPARRRLVATVKQAGTRLRLLGPALPTRTTKVRGGEALSISNSGASGVEAYLNVYLPLSARPSTVSYTLRLAPARLR